MSNGLLQLAKQHKRTTAAIGIGGLGLVGAGAALAYHSHKKRSKKSKRKNTTNRRRSYKQKQPHTAGKRRDTSRRRIRYTKNNQPYIILASGKARFISKKSARSSRKRTGGRY